jgi:hypothetical protein
VLQSPYKEDPTLSLKEAEVDKATFANVQSFYQSCKDTQEIAARNDTPFKNFLASYQSKYFPLADSTGELNAVKLAKALAETDGIMTSIFFKAVRIPDTDKIEIYSTNPNSLNQTVNDMNDYFTKFFEGDVTRRINFTDISLFQSKLANIIQM